MTSFTVASGATSSGQVLVNYETGTILAGGVAIGTAISSGGEQRLIGVASGTTVFYFGSERVFSGGRTIGTTVSSGGSQTVEFGGIASATTISSGGRQTVGFGGQDIGAIIISGGVQNVSGGGEFRSGLVSIFGSQVVFAGGVASGTTITFFGSQSISSGGVASGTTISDVGVQTVSDGGAAIDTTISNGGRQCIGSGGLASGTTINSGGTAFVHIDAQVSDLVLNSGGTIDLQNATFSSGGSIAFDSKTGLLTVVQGGATTTLDLAGSYTGQYFHANADTDGSTLITLDTVPCYLPGTLIRTDRGEMPIEALCIGDKVATVSGAFRPILWIGHRSYSGRFIAGNRLVLPVTIGAGALAPQLPARDLVVSPQHAIYLEGVLIEAKHLVNGLTITQAEAIDAVTYYNIDLGSHDLMFAEGAAAESFVGDDHRSLFQNAAEYHALYPDAPARETIHYAPRHDHGMAVHDARNRIARIAGLAEDGIATSIAMPPRGFVDRVTQQVAEGWVQCPDTPEERVLVEIVMDGLVVGHALTNRYRADLEEAGLGSGRHAFAFTATPGQDLRPDSVVVRRALDGAALHRSMPQQCPQEPGSQVAHAPQGSRSPVEQPHRPPGAHAS
jgi:autotransporter passenger strand-loop-strand repeat protein